MLQVRILLLTAGLVLILALAAGCTLPGTGYSEADVQATIAALQTPTPTPMSYSEEELDAAVATVVAEALAERPADEVEEVSVVPTVNPTAISSQETVDNTSGIQAVFDFLGQFEDTIEAERAFAAEWEFTLEDAMGFQGGMNHWTSGHESCNGPNIDPLDPEYCMIGTILEEETLVAYVFAATGLNLEDGRHLTGFIVTNQDPRSAKDAGMVTIHSSMSEADVAQLIYSRLFWTNRPGGQITEEPQRSVTITMDLR